MKIRKKRAYTYKKWREIEDLDAKLAKSSDPKLRQRREELGDINVREESNYGF